MKHTRTARKALIALTSTALALMLTFSFLPMLRANAKSYTAVKSTDANATIEVTLTPDDVTCTMGETKQVNIDLNHSSGLDLAFTAGRGPMILGEDNEWKSFTEDGDGNWQVDGVTVPARLMESSVPRDFMLVSNSNPDYYHPFLQIIPQTPGTFTVRLSFVLQDHSPFVYPGEEGGDYYDVDYELQITVKPAPTSLVLDPTSLSLQVGDSQTITATVTPDDADQSVTWESSNPDVATVDNTGKVTGVAEGEATITAKCKAKNSVTATCAVTVTAADQPTSSDPDDSEVTYTLTGDKTWKKGSTKAAKFKVTKNPDPENNVIEEFVRLEMDDKGEIEADNYVAKPGSIDITLKADYLKTLSDGKHTLKVVLTDRTLTAVFTISSGSETDSTGTGESGTLTYVSILLMTLAAFGVVYAFRRRIILSQNARG